MQFLDGLFGKPKVSNKDAENAARAEALRQQKLNTEAFVAGGAPVYDQGQQYYFNELGQLEQLGPSDMQNIQTDPRLMQAQYDALRELETRGREGFTARDELDRLKTKQDVAKENAGRLGAIQQNMAARGMGGSGMDLVAQLQASQAATEREALAGLERNAAQEANRANSSAQAGGLAGNIRGQAFGENSAKAQAQDAIKRFNTQNSVQRQQYNNRGVNDINAQNVTRNNQTLDKNTDAKYGFRKDAYGIQNNQFNQNYNAATEDLNQKRIQDEQARARKQAQISGITTLAGAGIGAAVAGPGGGMKGAQMGAGIGNAAGGAFYAKGGRVPEGKDCYASGGYVNAPEVVPWDDEANDIKQINVSGGEIVIPKSIANDPLASAQFVDQENRKQMQAARSQQDMMGLGNILGKAATDYGNAQNQGVVLANRMQDLGQKPSMYQTEKKQFDSSILDNMGKMGVDRATADAAQNEKAFTRDITLGQLAKDQDVNSESAKQSNLVLKAMLSNKAREAERAGDKSTAEALRSQATNLKPLSAKEAMAQYSGIKDLDYKTVLDSLAMDKKLGADSALKQMELQKQARDESKKDLQYKTGLEEGLRKEVSGDKIFQAASELNRQMAGVKRFAEDPNPTPQTDQSLITLFNKFLDPGSVVKESEFALTAAGTSAIGRAENLIAQYKTGERLTPQMRKDLVNAMKTIQDGTNYYLQGHLEKYKNAAENRGLNPANVFGTEGLAPMPGGQAGNQKPSGFSTDWQRKVK